MATMGGYFSNYSEQEKQPPVTEDKSKAFWDNPGFWAKVGEIGSALVGGKTRLGQAAKYAAGYHNAQQLDLAQRKVLQNAAAGVDPMTGMTGANTQGLSAEQISKLSDTGVARQSALVKEEREGKLAESTIKSGEAYRDYTGKLASQIDQKMAEKKKLDENWDLTIKGIEEGTIKSKYITPDMVPILKGLGREQADTIVKEVMREKAAADARGEKTTAHVDSKRGLIMGVNDKGVQWKVQYADPETAVDEKVGQRTRAERAAFQEVLPVLKNAFFASFGDNEKSAKEFNNLLTMLNDPMKSGQARDQLLSYASPEVRNAFYERENEITKSIAGGKGIPPIKDSKSPAAQDVTSSASGKTKEDRALFTKRATDLLRELTKKNGGREPTPQEMKEAYDKKYGGKK